VGTCKPIISADPYEIHSIYSDDEVDQAMTQESLKIDVKRALNELKDKEREVLEAYYGFKGKPKALDEIANKYGLSRERIRQIHVKAIRKLRVKSTYAHSPVRHLQYYIPGSYKLLEGKPYYAIHHHLPKKTISPKLTRRADGTFARRSKERLPKVIHLGDPDVTHTPKPTPKPIPKEIKKASPSYEEPKKPIARCLNCPNPRVSKDNLCSGCQDLKDKGYKLVYYERYLKRNRRSKDYEIYIKRRRRKRELIAGKKKDTDGFRLFSQRFIDKLDEIL